MTSTALTHIRKEADFKDLLTYGSKAQIFELKNELESRVRAAGTARSEFVDFCKGRLKQVRESLKLG